MLFFRRRDLFTLFPGEAPANAESTCRPALSAPVEHPASRPRPHFLPLLLLSNHHPPKLTGVCGHRDQIELVRLGRLRNQTGRIAGQENSGKRFAGKFRKEKLFEFVFGDVPVIFGYFAAGPRVKLESTVATEVANMKETHRRAPESRRATNVSSHGYTKPRNRLEIKSCESFFQIRHSCRPRHDL
jgi:hypothetical protein